MYEIKPATPEHIPVIYQLACDIWPDAYGNILPSGQVEYMLAYFYSSEALTDQMVNRGHLFILIYQDDIQVGFASFGPKEISKNTFSSGTFRLHKLYVLPTEQGKGTGRKLLEYIYASMQQHGATTLELNVNRNNPAINFYKKQGFIITREEDIDINNGFWMNDYVMEKRVEYIERKNCVE